MPGTRRWWCLFAVVLAITSATALTALGSITVMPSVFRNPLSRFVEPGVAVWWLVLGGPFRSVPASASGIAFAAAANAALSKARKDRAALEANEWLKTRAAKAEIADSAICLGCAG